jgi:hypothetical protein
MPCGEVALKIDFAHAVDPDETNVLDSAASLFVTVGHGDRRNEGGNGRRSERCQVR